MRQICDKIRRTMSYYGETKPRKYCVCRAMARLFNSLDVQYYDIFLYAVYPWFMLLLFLISGICSRYYLDNHTAKEFAKSRTRKLLIPSTIGLFVFQFIQGYVSMSISDAFDSMQEVPGVIKYFIMALSGTGVLCVCCKLIIPGIGNKNP